MMEIATTAAANTILLTVWIFVIGPVLIAFLSDLEVEYRDTVFEFAAMNALFGILVIGGLLLSWAAGVVFGGN